MEAFKNSDDGMSSVVAFVEGGVQEACDDSCSICLDEFSANDPSMVTNCRHEFHLQCILEWCQRSSNCPMCWQPISLKDAASQELLDAVEHDRKLKSISLINVGIHQHLGLTTGEAEFEERIFQHLVATNAMRRKEGQRNRSSSHHHHDSAVTSPQSPSMRLPNSPGARELPVSYAPLPTHLGYLLESRSFGSQSSQPNDDIVGPSDLHSLSDSLISRFNSWSTRYRESFSRNTRGLKERLLSRNTSSTYLSHAVQKEVDDRISGTSGSSNSPRRGNVPNTERTRHT